MRRRTPLGGAGLGGRGRYVESPRPNRRTESPRCHYCARDARGGLADGIARLREAAQFGEQQWTFGVELGRRPLRHYVYTPLLSRLSCGGWNACWVVHIRRRCANSTGQYANGLDVAGELVIFGLRRGGGSIDPFEPQDETVPADAAREYVFFGLLGPENHALYVDPRDDRVHLSGLNSADPLRSWPTFAAFLKEVVDEVLALLDADGQQAPSDPGGTRAAAAPALAAAPVPSEFQPALERLLRRLPTEQSALGEFVLYPRDGLGSSSWASATTPMATRLRWPPSWLVIGRHEDLWDPLIVDLADPAFPLYTAMTGTDSWDPDPVDAHIPSDHNRTPPRRSPAPLDRRSRAEAHRASYSTENRDKARSGARTAGSPGARCPIAPLCWPRALSRHERSTALRRSGPIRRIALPRRISRPPTCVRRRIGSYGHDPI